MRPVFRRGGAVVLGLIASLVVIALVQALNFQIHPPPAGLDPERPDELERIMRLMPLGAFVLIELSYAGGSFVGGWVARRVAMAAGERASLAVGSLLTLLGVANLIAVPHPVWMVVLTTLTYVPAAWLGSRVASGGPAN